MFNSAVAYEDFLQGLAASFETVGFKRVKDGFRRRTRHARLEIRLSRSRDTRQDRLICGLGAGADLKALDPFLRPKGRTHGITFLQFYDFFVTYRDLMRLPSADVGYWSIGSDADLANAITEAQRCVDGATRFFSAFESESDSAILSKLREQSLASGESAVAGHLRYAAYLLATGRKDEYQKAVECAANQVVNNERCGIALEKGRKKIEQIYPAQNALALD